MRGIEAAGTRAAAHPPINAAVVPLLAVAVFINYADRGNLATAAPLIRDQLHLTSTQIGILLSAFFWIYVPCQVLAGWMVQRINAYRTLALGLALWSFATAATGLTSSFTGLLVLRLLLGLGESGAFPGIAKLLAQHVPPDRLGTANGISLMGLGLGPAVGTFAGGLLIAHFGWRALFLAFGCASILWLVPWHFATRHLSAQAARIERPGPSYAALLARREFWGCCLGHFSGLYAFYFVISWLPLYLVKARGLSVVHMGEIGGMIYILFAAATLLSGLLADRLIRSGVSTNRVRKGGSIISLAIGAGSLLVAADGSIATSIACLFTAAIAFGIGTANIYVIPQTLAGPDAAGKWVAVQNGVGNIAGIVAPVITGMVIDRTGQFFWAFVAASAVALLGIVGWGVLVRKVAPLRWN